MKYKSQEKKPTPSPKFIVQFEHHQESSKKTTFEYGFPLPKSIFQQ